MLYRTPSAEKYTSFQIPKKRGGMRTIDVPVPVLKELQRRLSAVLYAVHTPRHSAHGFLQERGIATNASVHVGRRYVGNVDLESFFGSINFGRVRGLFLAKPYALSEPVATVLAQICCHENALPQGAPTSPIVSNMVATMLDRAMERLARMHGCRYSRYADDLTFSTDRAVFPPELLKPNSEGTVVIGEALAVSLQQQGFRPNREKVRLSNRRGRQEVTGLIVNEKVNVRREYIRQLRAMIHALQKYGEAAATAEHYRVFSASRMRPSRLERRRQRPHSASEVRPNLATVIEGKLEFLGSTLGKESPVYLNLLGRYQAAQAEEAARPRRRRGVGDDRAAQSLPARLEAAGIAPRERTMGESKRAGFGVAYVGRRLSSVFGESAEAESLKALLEDGRAIYMARSEQKRRERFPELEQTCADVAQALEAARPGSLLDTSLGRAYDFTGQPQLLARWEAAHDRVEASIEAARPPLPVKVGDWVRLGGHLVRVTATDLRRRTAQVELRDTRGIESAGDWCKADALVPVPHDTPAIPWPDPPETMWDGLARARFRMCLLSSAIEQAGLTPDPFLRHDD